MQPDLASLLDILQSAQLIQVYLRNVDLDGFLHDRKSQDAVVRRIEVIGEAVRRTSIEFRAAHPEIPWQDMAGMRSKLVHDYDRVNLM
jgi:uncharacterized protein with HEPN domain